MAFTDTTAKAGEKQTYRVIAVNIAAFTAGLRSAGTNAE